MKRLLASGALALVTFFGVQPVIPTPDDAPAESNSGTNIEDNSGQSVNDGRRGRGRGGDEPLPTATVTATIRPPRATVTKTVKPRPRPTKIIMLPGRESTVFVPGPTRTVSVIPRAIPGATVTVTAEPTNGLIAPPTETITLSTPTPTALGTIQTRAERDSVVPERGLIIPGIPIDFDDDGKVSAPEVGVSLLTLLGVAGLILLGLYLGYILGYKNKEAKEKDFLRDIRDQLFAARGKHN